MGTTGNRTLGALGVIDDSDLYEGDEASRRVARERQ
jgi:hypothetical protein